MKILIIARSFPPDSAIASVRPAMFAKYLQQFGNEVTVIRSGDIIFGHPSLESLRGLEGVRIFSYEGEDAAAEKFVRGGWENEITKKMDTPQNILGGLMKKIRHVLGRFLRPIRVLIRFYWTDGKKIEKKILKCANVHLKNSAFDCIISTFSPLGCISAGYKLKTWYGAKWIIDFRDLMDSSVLPMICRSINFLLEKKFVRNADSCLCVSKGNAEILRGRNQWLEENIHVINNGFDANSTDFFCGVKTLNKVLTLCYTGTLYGGIRNASPLFRVFDEIIRDKQVDIKLRILYAGNDGKVLLQQASEYGLELYVEDRGYLTREETARLQEESDLFLVISWNTRQEHGILTGKFYEALVRQKPVVALVSGDEPNSELRSIIEHYHLGVCYEQADHDSTYSKLKSYLEKQMKRKLSGQDIEYAPEVEAFKTFRYDNIVRELESIIKTLHAKERIDS